MSTNITQGHIRRICYHAGESYRDGEQFAVIRVVEDEPGYHVVTRFAGPDTATQHVTALNDQLGLSAEDVLDIRTSSIALSFHRLPDDHTQYAGMIEGQGVTDVCGCGYPITEYDGEWLHVFSERLTGTDDHDPEPR